MSKQELDRDRVIASNAGLSASLGFNLSGHGIDGQVTVGEGVEELFDQTWLAITSSHLGKSAGLHAEICRYLSRSMIDARERGFVVLVAVDSAIESWAKRAAELYRVPLLLVRVSDKPETPQKRMLQVTGHQLCRDRVVACLADRVDCVFARSGGKIEAALQSKLAKQSTPCVRIAVHQDAKLWKVSHALMSAGAVGLYCKKPSTQRQNIVLKRQSTRSEGMVSDNQDFDTWYSKGQWLIHCTRACNGPWPGQTQRQYQDELLLRGLRSPASTERSSLDSLLRILRTRRLVASALTSCRKQPVVCFSEQPLQTLLSRRSYRSHLHRWDYEPYGIAIQMSAALRAGAAKVIYGDPKDRKKLPAKDRFRFQARGTTYDWTEEKEWRFRGDVDLKQFNDNDVRVFVHAPDEIGEISAINSPYRVESTTLIRR